MLGAFFESSAALLPGRSRLLPPMFLIQPSFACFHGIRFHLYYTAKLQKITKISKHLSNYFTGKLKYFLQVILYSIFLLSSLPAVISYHKNFGHKIWRCD